MRKLSVLLFVLALLTGCANVPKPREYTIRPIGMSNIDFVKAADKVVFAKVPNWYVYDAEPVNIHIAIRLWSSYGRTWKGADGKLNVAFGMPALMLATVEDLAHVVLHEYVHVRIWDLVERMDIPKPCKLLRHEMAANKVVIENYNTIGYRPAMLSQARSLYAQAYTAARKGIEVKREDDPDQLETVQCPDETWIDFPEFIRTPGPPPQQLPWKVPTPPNPDDPFDPQRDKTQVYPIGVRY